MDSTIWLAKIFGPLLIIFGIWIFLFVKEIQKALSTMKSNTGLVHVVGFFNLTLGLLILSLHFNWSRDMTVLLTILGWVLVIRSLVLLFASTVLERMGLQHPAITRVIGFICIIWGIAIFGIVL